MIMYCVVDNDNDSDNNDDDDDGGKPGIHTPYIHTGSGTCPSYDLSVALSRLLLIHRNP